MPRSRVAQFLDFMRRGAIWSRAAICLLAMIAIILGTGSWNPPFPYRVRYVPDRELVARVAFEFENESLTREKRAKAVASMLCIYRNDPTRIQMVLDGVIEKLFAIVGSEADSYPETIWQEFYSSTDDPQQLRQDFDAFRRELKNNDPRLEKTRAAISQALEPYFENGLLEKLQHEVFQGSTSTISVYQEGDPEHMKAVSVSDVRILEQKTRLLQLLKEAITSQGGVENADLLVDRIGYWIHSHFQESLKFDRERTREREKHILAAVPIELKTYAVGDKLAYDSPQGAGKGDGILPRVPLDKSDLEILMAEHQAYLQSLTSTQKTIHLLAAMGMCLAVFLLCGSFLYHRERQLIRNLGRFSFLVAAFAVTIILTCNLEDRWRVELIPVTVFAMILSVAYRHEIAWMVGAGTTLATCFLLGMGIGDFVIIMSALVTGSLLCRDISSRSKLFYVGLLMATVTFATTLGVGVLTGQADTWQLLASNQLLLAAWFAFCAFLSSLLITVMLPFVEKALDIQTDLTLLEWSDPSHELLNKMIQRAPGTYNHSINVASIAETAAESIGANGLLCRVAAYYHDIGKILKPEYFVENQKPGENRHDSLVPAMSALVIIAHVKDGVELARKHRLPTCMIDMILQHHGTTKVEYFYEQALREAREKGTEEEVDESNFRYPGPKPQTREACVMMLADAVESACRTLTEPAPARIESLVKEISARKLNEGQFTECPLTLQELNRIEESLTKSLISVYHSRIKYPEQNGVD